MSEREVGAMGWEKGVMMGQRKASEKGAMAVKEGWEMRAMTRKETESMKEVMMRQL